MDIDRTRINLPSPLADEPVLLAPLTWPASLPDCPDQWSEQAEPVIVRTNVEEAIPKVRKRFTKRIVRMQVGMTMTITQRNTLDSFFYTSLDGGVLTFNFRHPWNNVVQEFRMCEAPQFGNEGPLAVNVSMVWELV